MFWVIIFMLQSIWWQFPLFEFVTQLLWVLCLSPRPQRTYPFVFENGDFFATLVWPIVHPCQVKTVSENACFQIALQSRNFRKRRLLDSCRCKWRKNEYVTVLDPVYPAHEMRRNAHAPIKEGTAFSHYCIFVWTGKNDSKTQRDEKSGGKKSPLSNKNGYVWTGTNWVKTLNVHTFWQHTHLSSSSRWINFLSKLSTFNRWS